MPIMAAFCESVYKISRTRLEFGGIAMRRILLAGVLAIASAGSVFAQGFDWTRMYAGATLGWGSSTQQWTSTAAVTTGGFSGDGWVAGATLGRNWQNGNKVYGFEADLQLSDISATETVTGGCSVAAPCTASIDWYSTMRGRFGILTGDTLLFATGGLAIGQIENDQPALSPLANATTTKVGWTVGLGLETPMKDDWTFKAQIDYLDFGETDFCPAAGCLATVVSDYTRVTTIRVGVNKHF